MKAMIGMILISVCASGVIAIRPFTPLVFLILTVGSLAGLFLIIDQYAG